MAERVLLSKDFGKNILTRNSMNRLFNNKINKSKDREFIIDFRGVNFISRSCASEYVKLREETSKNLIEKNMSSEIKSMFSLVNNQLNNARLVSTKRNLVDRIKV